MLNPESDTQTEKQGLRIKMKHHKFITITVVMSLFLWIVAIFTYIAGSSAEEMGGLGYGLISFFAVALLVILHGMQFIWFAFLRKRHKKGNFSLLTLLKIFVLFLFVIAFFIIIKLVVWDWIIIQLILN